MHTIDLEATHTPRLPRSGARQRALACLAASLLHGGVAGGVWFLSHAAPFPTPPHSGQEVAAQRSVDVTRIVFIPSTLVTPASGGGGGGNGQAAPIRRASGVGTDAITLRVRKPVSAENASRAAVDVLPALVLDAVPLASGTIDQVGLPEGGVSYGESTGPGSGGGVGSGTGTGIGPGRGPGLGPGEGGGTGGGVYRAGGSVSAPRVITQVRPDYTADALERRVEGTVELAIVVRRDGCASDIRVIRSLDAGLDEQAVRAVGQWRFAPGRFADLPVDVAVTVLVDFMIR